MTKCERGTRRVWKTGGATAQSALAKDDAEAALCSGRRKNAFRRWGVFPGLHCHGRHASPRVELPRVLQGIA